MPHLFAQLAFPQASLEVLRTFLSVAGIPLDLSDLEDECEAAEGRLEVLLHRIEGALREEAGGGESESFGPPLEEAEQALKLSADDRDRIEILFKGLLVLSCAQIAMSFCVTLHIDTAFCHFPDEIPV